MLDTPTVTKNKAERRTSNYIRSNRFKLNNFFKDSELDLCIKGFSISNNSKTINLEFYITPKLIDGIAKQPKLIHELKIRLTSGEDVPVSSIVLKRLTFLGITQNLNFDYATNKLVTITIGYDFEELLLYGTQVKNGPLELPLRI